MYLSIDVGTVPAYACKLALSRDGTVGEFRQF
jgi:hypothetical protein